MFLVPFALTGKTTASCLLSLFLISELFPKQDTPHQPFGISSISVVTSSSMQFVLTATCTEAKSKELVIWAPTVVMRHLQCNRPNQIFGCASSDAISHIVTVVLAEQRSLHARGDVLERDGGVGRGGRKGHGLSPVRHLCAIHSAFVNLQDASKSVTPLGAVPNLHNANKEWQKIIPLSGWIKQQRLPILILFLCH